MTPHDDSYPDSSGNGPHSRRDPNPVAGRIAPRRRPPLEDGALAAPPGLSSSADVGAYLRALRRRWVAALALGGSLAVVAGLAAWFLLSPKYIAFALVRVAYEQPSFTTAGTGNFLTTLKTQATQITSRPVIWAALKRDEVKRLNLDARFPEPAQFIQKEMKAEVQDNSEIITITLGTSDPAVSLAIVKAIAASYIDEFAYAETRTREEKVHTLDQAFSGAAGTLKAKKDRLNDLTKTAGAADPQVQTLRLMEIQSRIRESTSQQNNIRLELVRAEADLASHDAKMNAPTDPTLSRAALNAALKGDPEAQKLRAEMQRFQNIIDEYRVKQRGQSSPTLREAHGRVQALRSRYEAYKKDLQEDLEKNASTFGAGGREEMRQARLQKVNQIKALNALHKKLGEEVIAHTEELNKVKHEDNTQEILRDEIHTEEKIVEELSGRLSREKLDLKAAPRITLYQDAELQQKDMKKQIMGTIVAPLAVFLSVCMVLAWTEVRQRRVRSAGEVAHGLGIRIVGAVPAVAHLERHLIGPAGEPDLEAHPVLESIDAIRTLLLADGAEAHRVVMVTSATTGEGKTTLASHLASSLARAGRKTLLIDGDLRTPAAHQLFELPMQPGFSEVLLGEVEVTDAVQNTPQDGLSFMAAGQWDREVMGALARDGLEGIFEKLQEEFDFIVIDSHPVLPATDSLLIGQRVDAVILSVLREVSQMPRVYAASQRLTTLGIRVLGAVVNGADPEEALAATANARLAAA